MSDRLKNAVRASVCYYRCMEDASKKIEELIARNRRVELEKAWETSWTRKLSITAMTYAAAFLILTLYGDTRAVFNAGIPAGAFLLSTLSLPWIKAAWLKRRAISSEAV